MLAIRLPDAMEERLNSLAQETGRTKTALAREAIAEYIDDLEDRYLAEARAQEPQDYSTRRGGEKAWALKSNSIRMH